MESISTIQYVQFNKKKLFSYFQQGDCRTTIELLLKEMMLAGFGVMENVDATNETSILNVLNVQQIKVTDLDGNLRTVYPNKTDLHFDESSNISVERE